MNYKADGTPFWNQFFVAALRDDTDKVRCLPALVCLSDISSLVRTALLPACFFYRHFFVSSGGWCTNIHTPGHGIDDRE